MQKEGRFHVRLAARRLHVGQLLSAIFALRPLPVQIEGRLSGRLGGEHVEVAQFALIRLEVHAADAMEVYLGDCGVAQRGLP